MKIVIFHLKHDKCLINLKIFELFFLFRFIYEKFSPQNICKIMKTKSNIENVKPDKYIVVFLCLITLKVFEHK